MDNRFMNDYIKNTSDLKGKTIKEIDNLVQGGFLYIITDDCKWTILEEWTPNYSDYDEQEVGIYPVDNSLSISELLDGDKEFVNILEENTDFDFKSFLEEKRQRESKSKEEVDLRNLKYLIETYKDEATEMIKRLK